jgi:heavy metal efflux system protein
MKILGRNLAIQESWRARLRMRCSRSAASPTLASSTSSEQPNLDIKVDRDKAARYGLNTGDVNTTIQAALGGTVATTLLEGDRQFNVTVRLPEEYRDSLEAVPDIKVAGGTAYIPLRELADITHTGASHIYHESRSRYLPIVVATSVGAVAGAQTRIAST